MIVGVILGFVGLVLIGNARSQAPGCVFLEVEVRINAIDQRKYWA